VCESKRDSEMFFSFSFLYCISAVNRNGAAVLGEKTKSSFANFLLFNRNTEKGRVIRNREGVRVSLRVLQSCIVFCEEHELLLLELKERNRDSKEKRRTCCHKRNHRE
jgi:hypothetical protein